MPFIRPGRSSYVSAPAVGGGGNDDPIPEDAIWISPSGNDTTGAGTSVSPWKTFAKGFTNLTAGKTLVCKDGTYTDSCGSPTSQPPNGTSLSNMTRIRAENPGGATVDRSEALYPLDLRSKQYVRVSDMRFVNGGEFCISLDGGSNCKVDRCFAGNSEASNFAVHISLTGDNHALEDVWSCGRGRGIIAYGTGHVIRRYVVRLDSYTGDQGYMGITLYDCNNTIIENCIAIDYNTSGTAFDWKGGFRSRDQTVERTQSYYGCIALKTIYDGFRLVGSNIENCVAVDTAGAGAFDEDNYYSSRTWKNLTAVNATGGHIRLGGANNFHSSLAVNCTGGGSAGDRCHYESTTSPGGTNVTTGASGLLYPVRIEAGSACDGTGLSGADRGANILKRYVNGSLTADDIWPWPNEARIKSDFSTNFGLSNPTRGFCAAGNDAFGQPITLTRYIWQTLGNQIPSGIY